MSKIKPLKWIVNFYVWIMRGTPLLLQLIFVFYGLPIIHIVFPRYQAALFAFVLNYAAYFAEIFRGGFQSIDQGQFWGGTSFALESLADNDQDRYSPGDQNRVAINR